MEDLGIPDDQITASSERPGFSPHNGRLNQLPRVTGPGIIGGAWKPDVGDGNPWIQIAFGLPKLVTGVTTQGRHGFPEWVTQFSVQYSNDAVNWYNVLDKNKVHPKVRSNFLITCKCGTTCEQ